MLRDPASRFILCVRLSALLLAGFGLLLMLGGVLLIRAGGSWWYGISGLLLLLSATLLWRRQRGGVWLYGLIFIGALLWSWWEVGFNLWAWLPRLLAFAVIGLWLLTPWVRRGLRPIPAPLLAGLSRRSKIATAALLVIAVVLGMVLLNQGPVHISTRAASVGMEITDDWQHYGNDAAGTRYSALAQINDANVGNLKLAWRFQTGDLPQSGQHYNFEATPLKIGSLLYFCTPSGQVFALDAATGTQRWHFDAKPDTKGVSSFICRGVSYFKAASSAASCAERIYVATPDAKLWGLDALTGQPCLEFGVRGSIDLLLGLGEVQKGTYNVTSPPLVTHGKLIVGASVADNISTDMPSGVVRAFDAITGELAWAWDVGHPDRMGAPPPGETYTRSTPNAWAPLVADDDLGLVYIPTGNPAADYWGKQRRPFDEKYSDSLVAVAVDTGKTRWHYQVTHHDLWDNDLSSQPILMQVPTPQGMQPAVIFGTKQGNIFVLNRVTGEPIVPVTEQSAPMPSDIGEHLSSTQPVSALAVNPGPTLLTEASMWGMTPVDQLWCRIQFRRARYEGPYTPPGTRQATIVFPGMFGGIEWGGVSVDPHRKILIANPNAMPFIVRMVPTGAATANLGPPPKNEGEHTGLVAVAGTGYASSYYPLLSPLKVPCLQPPWGKLYAIDLQTREILWQRPVGTVMDSGPFGINSHLPIPMGTPQVGGTIVTRGGLIFSAATLDNYLHAYAVDSGKLLWKARLPAGGQATPMTYLAEGRQFVVIAAGGHTVLGTKAGDYLLAYALNTK